MKKWIVLCSLALSVFLSGQDLFRVNKTDSTSQDYEMQKISNLTFSDFGDYRLKVNKADGSVLYFDLNKITDLTFTDLTGIEDQEEILSKMGISLLSNYPNPFNPETVITFKTQNDGLTKVAVFNHLGQFVTELHNGNLPAGNHSVRWNAQENKASSGVYFVKVSQNEQVLSSKMLLIK